MATATIRNAWTENGHACLAAEVVESDGSHIEYIGRVALDDAWQAMTAAQKKAALVAAVKAVRDGQQTVATASLGITGTVTV